MPAQILSQASSFNAGAELWVIPELKNCNSAPKLDWLLNFQIAKTSRHQAKELPQATQRILKLCELKEYDFISNEHDCLMIISKHLVPANWVVVVKNSENFESWVKTIFQKWRGLAYPSLRVFLPTGTEAARFESLWHAEGGTDQLSLVVDNSG